MTHLMLQQPTLILRHRKENLKKCSLRGLEGDFRFQFYRYPLENHSLPNLDGYVLLSIDGEPLTIKDRSSSLLLIDGTWRYAAKMAAAIDAFANLPRRQLPPAVKTAYPRCQTACPLPEYGLASVEALYSAYAILDWETDGLLDHYFWRESFLEKNRSFFTALHSAKQ